MNVVTNANVAKKFTSLPFFQLTGLPFFHIVFL